MRRINPDENIATLLDRWPESARLFIDFRMNCVGCDMSKFETLESACAIYHIDLDVFINQLQQIIQPFTGDPS